jgi:hypothetical protein
MISRHQLIRISESLLYEVLTSSNRTNFIPSFVNNLSEIEKSGQARTQRGDVNEHVSYNEGISCEMITNDDE